MSRVISTGINPVTFEVLRHRFWSVNNEMALTLGKVSGSPTATESGDFNTGLLDARGNMLLAGVYVTAHAATLDQVVGYILTNYSDNPGVEEGDIFLCNDPYIGALHQNDVVCVGPIHWQGEVVGWAGSALHQVDVGGPAAGGPTVGATSIFGEPLPTPPLKIVEGGVVRKDIMAAFLNRSRTPELIGLDLHAQLAAVNVARERFQRLIEQYGVDTVRSAMSGMIEYAEAKLRQRLREIPDGVWTERQFIDHDGLNDDIYPLVLRMEKKGEHLTFDFTECAPQAPALINCSFNVLKGAVISPSLPLLGYDMPWTPAAFWRVIELKTTPGTVVHATWPAGVSAAPVEAGRSVASLVNLCIGKMLSASRLYEEKSAAGWCGAVSYNNLYGVDERGNNFGTMLADSMAGGAAASYHDDGVDSGGSVTSLASSIANVETNEYALPLLYLFRRHAVDSGGAGRTRGGNSVELAFIPYGTPRPLSLSVVSRGVESSPTMGIGGGYPGSTCPTVLLRDSDVREVLTGGHLPVELQELGGRLEVLPAKVITSVSANDVFFSIFPGGSGYADPILRDPDAVARDVGQGMVSTEAAETTYGVSLFSTEVGTSGTVEFTVDLEGTDRLRQKIRSLRAQRAGHVDRPVVYRQSVPGEPFTPSLTVEDTGPGLKIYCRQCGGIVSSDQPWKVHAAMAEYPLTQGGLRINQYAVSDRLVHREYYCKLCWTCLDIEIGQKDDLPLQNYLSPTTNSRNLFDDSER